MNSLYKVDKGYAERNPPPYDASGRACLIYRLTQVQDKPALSAKTGEHGYHSGSDVEVRKGPKAHPFEMYTVFAYRILDLCGVKAWLVFQLPWHCREFERRPDAYEMFCYVAESPQNERRRRGDVQKNQQERCERTCHGFGE